MSPLCPLLLAGAVGALGLLPFLPMLRELRRKTDVEPLSIALDYDGNIRHFAKRFRSYMQSQLPGTTESFAGDLSIVGRLQDGTPFVKAKGDVEPVLPPYGEDERLTQRILLAYTALSLPEKTAFTKEIYAADTLFGGAGDIYRAVLGDRDVLLGRGSMVLRWLHAEGKVHAARGSTLYGRTSSEQLIRLAEGCRFERLHAPRVEFGAVSPAETVPELDGAAQPFRLPGAAVTGRRHLVRGNLTVPAGSSFDGDLVVRGALRVGAGARISGSVKSHRDMLLEPGARIEGSAVSARNLRIGAGCRVAGPVIAEGAITIDTAVHLGTEQQPTTVSAPRIAITPGAVAFGTVWAREGGEVAATGEDKVKG